MKKLGNMIQTKEQDKAPVSDPNKKNIYEFTDRKCKIAKCSLRSEQYMNEVKISTDRKFIKHPTEILS